MRFFVKILLILFISINFASSSGVRGVPTTIIMKKGVEIDRLVGNPGEAAVKEFLNKNI